MKHKFSVSSFFTASLLVVALAFSPLKARAAVEDSSQVSQLLEDIKMQAADFERDCEELESFTHSNQPWSPNLVEIACEQCSVSMRSADK